MSTQTNSLGNSINSQTNSISNALNQQTNNIGNQFANNSKQMLDGMASNTYILTLFLFLACIGFVMFYFLSKQFRVAKTLTYMKIYTNFQTLTSMNKNDLKDKDSNIPYKLSDFYIASSFNSAHSGYQLFDYVSLEMLHANLRSGARFLEFTIFNDKFGEDAIPVISNGYQVGEWQLTANTITFEDACVFIRDNAFAVSSNLGGVYNPKDPLFISLNLKTNYNLKCLDRIQKIILKNFRNRLLPAKYGYSKRNIGEIPLADLMGKVVIFSTDGYQGSKLEEFINYNWDKDGINRIHIDDLESGKGLLEHNKKKLTMIYPHKEGDFWTTNYDPNLAWRYGCQFVAMNFQKVDTGMDSYISKFKNKSFTLKPPNIRN